MLCPKCQKIGCDPGKFCSNCGTKCGTEPVPSKCKNCGEKIYPHENYCRNCGLSREEAPRSDSPQK